MDRGLESELISMNPLNGIHIQWGEAGRGRRSDQVPPRAPSENQKTLHDREGFFFCQIPTFPYTDAYANNQCEGLYREVL